MKRQALSAVESKKIGFKHVLYVQSLNCSVRFIIYCIVLTFSESSFLQYITVLFLKSNKSLINAVKLIVEISQ